MIFTDRREAGRALAKLLKDFADRKDVLVLGVPRGGVPVAYEVATALGVPLDIFVLRKLGVPGHEELAFGAIGSGGVRILNVDIVEKLGISEADIAAVTKEEVAELMRRERLYRGDRVPLEVQGQTVILVDDGVATGASLRAGIQAMRKLRPAAIVVATPVAPRTTCKELRQEVEELVCAQIPEPFFGVGQFYEDFSQVTDAEVIELLKHAWGTRIKTKSHAA